MPAARVASGKSTLRVEGGKLGRKRDSTALPSQLPLVFAVAFAQTPSSGKIPSSFWNHRQPHIPAPIAPAPRCRRQTEGRGTRNLRRLVAQRGILRLEPPRNWCPARSSISPRQLLHKASMRSWEMFRRLCGRCLIARARSLPMGMRRAHR